MASRPTAKRRRLARQLRDLRIRSGLNHQQAAERVGCHQPKISKMENAVIALDDDDVRQLAELYGAPPGVVESMTTLARQAKRRGWHHSYTNALKDESLDYFELETDACRVSNFEIDLIPGLLQTEEYARAVIRAADPEAADDLIEKRVALRMERQQRVLDGRFGLWVVITEAALLRQVGGSDVHRAQLSALLQRANHFSVQLQAIPTRACEYMAMGVPFTIFGFGDGDAVVAIDHLTGTLYLEETPDVERYKLAFQHLCGAALSTRESLSLVRSYVEEDQPAWSASG
jgi:transcriptional regulator with XRE-family HTH domain